MVLALLYSILLYVLHFVTSFEMYNLGRQLKPKQKKQIFNNSC